MLGATLEVYDDPEELTTLKGAYIMAVDYDIAKDKTGNFRKKLEEAECVWLFVSPTWMPGKWGRHPNFVTSCRGETLEWINSQKNIHLWSFLSPLPEYFGGWKHVHHVPLAFDTENYDHALINTISEPRYDICFVGGWANNGFNEKKKIILDVLGQFQKTNYRCGFFINKNLTRKQENEVLASSKVCLNIHDAYQRELKLDVNERTFKSLGINGCLLTDVILEDVPLTHRATLYTDENLLEKAKFLIEQDRSEPYLKMGEDCSYGHYYSSVRMKARNADSYWRRARALYDIAFGEN